MSSLLAAKFCETLVGQLRQRPGSVASKLVGRRLARRRRRGRAIVRLKCAVLVIDSEVQLVGAHQRRVSGARGADPAVIVEARVDRVGGEQPGVDAQVAGLVGVTRRDTDAAGVDEGVVKRRALDEA